MQSPTAILSKPAPAPAEEERPGFVGMLDRLLRQRDGFFEEIFAGRNVGRLIRSFLLVIVSLSVVYGVAMGTMAFGVDVKRGLLQMISSGVKVPLLYLLSIAVCYPVLYIVIVLMGAKLDCLQTLTLILLALALNSVLLTSCAPIVLFFTFTGSDYHFVKLLHVVIFAFSGIWAMMALWQGLRAMCEKSDLYPKQAIRILKVWILIFGFVGTQMAWSLRPFVGEPGMKYQWVRTDQRGNFYEAVVSSIVNLGRETIRKLD